MSGLQIELSRADHSSGVMKGDAMVQHIRLNETAFYRSPKRFERFQALTKGLNFTFLEPHQWFDEYHDYRNYVWFPPPAAVDAAVDLLNKARHKRPESLHLVVVPRLMTGRCRHALTRTSDVYFRMDWEDCWPLSFHYEPGLCFVCLPTAVASPKLRCQEGLSSVSDNQKWSILRKFLREARSLCTLPGSIS